MNYIEINIQGDFWEYLLKDNLIYLWEFNGTVSIYNWDYFILDLTVKNNNVSIYQLMQNKSNKSFNKSIDNNIKLDFTLNDLAPYFIKKIENPFKQLPIVLDIYKDNFYAILDDGFFKLKRDSKIPDKLWDSKLFNFNITKNGKVAMSGGTDGLFEHSINEKNTMHVSDRYSTISYWNKKGIYSSSNRDESYLVVMDDNKYNNYKYREIVEDELFSNQVLNGGISWASNNNIYRIFDHNKVEVVSLFNDNDFYKNRSRVIEFESWKGKVLAGRNASFGNLVECENALVLLHNNGFENISGEIVTWRVFNNNPYYFNHLGIIFEEKISLRGYQLDMVNNR